MILVDVGNTTIHMVRSSQGAFGGHRHLPTARSSVVSIKRAIKRYGDKPIVICSVVPRVSEIFCRLRKDAVIIGKHKKVPIRCRYNKKEVGQDRLVGAYAANVFYPGTRIVIDFGTAITFDILSRRGDYAGGFIFPGVDLSLDALSACALIPLVPAKAVRQSFTIPKNTAESTIRGVCEGTVLMINAWAAQYAPRFLRQTRVLKNQVVITGGGADLIRRRLTFAYRYDPDLIFRGMRHLAGT